ncbi:hypothetical protein [uncultured Hymenobacter sp.]|uniref:hypothetical protein n=1 Tax=uncultured Hymenobacter sp. TaxID=170016 RepID=UPI0035CA6374
MATGTIPAPGLVVNRGIYAVLGIRALVLLPFQPGVECFYSTPDLSEVSTLGISVAGGVLLTGRTPGQLTQQAQTTQQGALVSQKLNFAAPDPTDALAGPVLRLVGQPVHGLAQDLNGRWWFIGQEFGLTLEVQHTPGIEVSLALAAQSTQQAPRVAVALIPGFLSLLS